MAKKKRTKKMMEEMVRLLAKWFSVGLSGLTREPETFVGLLASVEYDRMVTWLSSQYDLAGARLDLKQYMIYNPVFSISDPELIEFLYDVFPEGANDIFAQIVLQRRQFRAEAARAATGEREVTENTVAEALRDSLPPPAHPRQETQSFEVKPLAPTADYKAPPPAKRESVAATAAIKQEPRHTRTLQPGCAPPEEKKPLADLLDESLGAPSDASKPLVVQPPKSKEPEGYVPHNLVEIAKGLTAAEKELEESGVHGMPEPAVADTEPPPAMAEEDSVVRAKDASWETDSELNKLPEEDEFQEPSIPPVVAQPSRDSEDRRGIYHMLAIAKDDPPEFYQAMEEEMKTIDPQREDNMPDEELDLEEADESDVDGSEPSEEERATQDVTPEQVVETTQVSPPPAADDEVFTSVKANEPPAEPPQPAEPPKPADEVGKPADEVGKPAPAAVPVGAPVTEMPEPKPEKSLTDVVDEVADKPASPADKPAEEQADEVIPPMASLPTPREPSVTTTPVVTGAPVEPPKPAAPPQPLRIPTMEQPIPAALRPEALSSLPSDDKNLVPPATPATVKAVEADDAKTEIATAPTMSAIKPTPMPDLPLPKTFKVLDEQATRQGFPPPATAVPPSQDNANKPPATSGKKGDKRNREIRTAAMVGLIFIAVIAGVLVLVGKEGLNPPKPAVTKPAVIKVADYLPPCAEADTARAISRLRDFAEGKMTPAALTDCYPSSNSGECATLLPGELVYQCCARIVEATPVSGKDPLGESIRCGALTASFLLTQAEKKK